MKWTKLTTLNDVLYWTAGVDVNGNQRTFGKLKSQMNPWEAAGHQNYFAWLRKIVCPGLVMTKHIFQGLKRPLQYRESPSGAEGKYIYTWTPANDYEHRDRFDDPVELPAPAGKCFMVIVSPNTERDNEEFTQVNFWIEHWTWVEAEGNNSASPIDFSNRFDRQLK